MEYNNEDNSYECPECNYTEFNEGIYRWKKIIAVLLIVALITGSYFIFY